jgi:hypothetical protein
MWHLFRSPAEETSRQHQGVYQELAAEAAMVARRAEQERCRAKLNP